MSKNMKDDSLAFHPIKDANAIEVYKKEIKKLNEEIHSLRFQVQQLSSFNKDLEQFSYVASHDLHEPLRMVSNFVQLLAHEYAEKLGEDGQCYINFAVDGVKRMQKLIDDLLMYNRMGKPNIQVSEVDTTDIVFLVLHKLNALIKEKKAQVDVVSKLPTIKYERNQLAAIFYNLIKNAITFNKDTPPILTVSCEENEAEWIFKISDNGIGIDVENHEKIFNVFYRLNDRPNAESTGIGLAMCRKIILRHGGKIWLESTPGNGSVFYFSARKNIEEVLKINNNN